MSASADADADPNLTPLLDLVLQIIMFFMITVNFIRVDQFDEVVKLPVAQHAVPLDATADKFIFLNLDAKGLLVGQVASLTLDTPGKLQAHLHQSKAAIERDVGKNGPKVVVVLRADKEVRYDKVWEVLDSCKRAGFVHWQLRVMTGGASS